MLKHVAIVNRGEAAMRFLNAAGEYGMERGVPLETVALYTDADAGSWFVREADHAVHLGPTMSTDPVTGARRHTYLDLDVLETALRSSGADSVWPGWGFVAENPDFVRLCERIGVRFIGPSAEAMDKLGDKIAAKRVAESAEVPVVPWSHGPVATADDALAHAHRIGFPVVIKAAAGGGGRGIRVVRDAAELPAAFAGARSEAESAFGDPTLFLEAQVLGGRHFEVQVAADTAGTVWALGLRDCSVQRRRQKVLEESAPVDIDAHTRRRILDAARRLCRTVGYTGVGTVEFLARPDTGDFYFLEVNTRLQVEHTVTESVTGVDLVKLQLDIAEGLPLIGDPPEPRGHAVEVRLNAEDPRRGFAPAPSRVVELRIPQGPSIRTDAGVVAGDSIASEFDSMIAKVIAWGRDRDEALARLRRALARSAAVVEGGTTNRRFLMASLDNADIRAGHVDTTWLDRALDSGVLLDAPDAAPALVAAAVEAYRRDHADALDRFAGMAAYGRLDPVDDTAMTVELEYEGERRRFTVRRLGADDFEIEVDGTVVAAQVAEVGKFERRMVVGDHEMALTVVAGGPLITVEAGHSVYRIVRGDGGLVRAESQCVVAKVLVSVGDEVRPGEVLLIAEAMKMESPVVAPAAGRITEIVCPAGTLVGAGDPIIRMEALDQAAAGVATQLSFTDLAAHQPDSADTDRDTLVRLILGQDLDDDAAAKAIARIDALPFDAGLQVLRAAADRMALFADHDDADTGTQRRSPRPDLLLLALRSPDRLDELAPGHFPAQIRSVLAYYGVTEVSQSPELTDALYHVWRAESRMDRVAQVSALVLQSWLEPDHDTVDSTELVEVVDAVITAAELGYPGVADLGRAVRHRLVEHPAIRELRSADERYAATLLAGEQADVTGLLHLPAPLDRWLAAHAVDQGPEAVAALEALLRRTHRHHALGRCAALPLTGITGVTSTRSDNGNTVVMVAVAGTADRLGDVLSAAAGSVETTGVVDIDLFVGGNGAPDATALESTIRRVFTDVAGRCDHLTLVITWWEGGRFTGAPRHLTVTGGHGDLAVATRHGGMHPAAAERLELWRFDNFALSGLPAPDGVHLLHATARENRNDQRLIAILEVFDLDPAHLTGQLSEAAIAIRQARAALPDPSVSLSNRIVIHAEPTWTLTDSELQKLIAELLPLTRGLGLEKVIGRVVTHDPDTGERSDEVLHITTPARVGVMVGRTKPSHNTIRPMSEYRRRVVTLQRRGLVYPYEIVELLVGTGATHTELPVGDFVEYDFTDEGFAAVERPRGQNTARVVTGVIDSRPAGSTATIRRVLIMNEPSRDLASLAEPECRRIIAALDLAAELGIPAEWYAVSSGARIAMDSGTENLDATAAVLRRIIEFTQAGGEINVVVVGVNVGAQSYFDAEATMLMHTSGVLIMVGRSAMVLTGKQALEFSGGVAAEDNTGIGGYARIAGPNGQAQFWVPDVESACAVLFRHYESSLPHGAWRPTTDPVDRDITPYPHRNSGNGTAFATVGEIFSAAHNPDRKRPFDIRSVLSAVRDQDAPPLERWTAWQDAENVVAWDTRLGGFAVSLVGIESRNLRRRLPRPANGPDSWTAGTLFPQSSKKLARVINGASGRRPLVILANLSGFDGSPESMSKLQLEYGAEIGRAIVNYRGPIVFTVISRYHGGAYVVFSKALNPHLEVAAVEGSRASVIGGAPAAAVVFTREVRARVKQHPAVLELQSRLTAAPADEQPVLTHQLHELTAAVTTEVQAAVAQEFDDIHTVERALEVGSIDHIVTPTDLRPYLIGAVSRGLENTSTMTGTEYPLTEGLRHA